MEPYSEYYDQLGHARPHIQPLLDFIAKERAGRGEEMRAAVRAWLRENEVSYNLLGTPGGSTRPWEVDEIPYLIEGGEFQDLAGRLSQRGLLLSACLSDFYGSMRLVREGIVPAELVLGNPNYYRSLRDVQQLAASRLILYAVDVVRDPSGSYVVHSDRSAAPTGSGYALENRLVIGQLHGDIFRKWRVAKINSFFHHMRDALEQLSPRVGYAPRIVVLTPGIQDESSFEHAYLARYQGFELVEGRDLTVRGDEVFLKTLEGLQRVDVILRRVRDGDCDPLELRDDSFSGVSGLVAAARAGKVGIANPLGSGLIESPAFRAYLPEIAEALGMPLGLKSIPTRYLGDRRHLEEVLDTFDAWLIRPAFGDRREVPEPVSSLSFEAKDKLRKAVLEGATRLVAESWPLASRVPVGAEMARTGVLSLRLFSCFTGGGYACMHGALGRVDDTPDGLFLHAGTASSSKDVWIVGQASDDAHALPKMPEPPLTIRRGGVNVPSRLFDDVFWLGRYATRSAYEVRLVRFGLAPLTAEANDMPAEAAEFLARLMSVLRMATSALVPADGLGPTLIEAITDPGAENSIVNCLSRIHWLTSETRSRLSVDSWQCLRRISNWSLGERVTSAAFEKVSPKLDELYFSLAAFQGITHTSVVRGPVWIFLELGRRIEQAVFVLTLLAEAFRFGITKTTLEMVLALCDSLMTYRARYLSSLQAPSVIDLVLTDSTNPQSVLFQVQRLLRSTRSLRPDTFPLSVAQQELIRLEARLLTTDLNDVCSGDGSKLVELAEAAISDLWRVSDDLTQAYFAHANPARIQNQSEQQESAP